MKTPPAIHIAALRPLCYTFNILDYPRMYTGPLFIACDHGGFQLKKRLVRYFENELELPITDLGAHEYTDDDDYPDFAFPLAEKVRDTGGRGILACKNAIGVSIAANKVKGIRAGVSYNLAAAESMMTDDNTNIICLSANLSSDEHAMAMVKRWLETPFSNAERHVRRLKKVADYENR